MKSILVPTEQHALLPSTLQCALLLARKFDSYVEGFALFPAMVELYALDFGVLLIEEVRIDDAEMAKQSREAFETFMTKNRVARSNANGGLSFGWLDSRPTGILSSAATAACSISSYWGGPATAGGRGRA